jgi:hypothetical protein
MPLKDGFLEHIYDDYTRFHSIEIVRSTKAADLLKPIKKAIYTFKRLWNFKVIPYKLAYKPPLCGPCKTNGCL